MRKLGILFSFWCLFVTGVAQAQHRCEEGFQESPVNSSLVQLMTQMKRTGNYEPDFCNTNAFRLVEMMEIQGFDIAKTEVLYLIPIKGEDFLFYPQKAIIPVESWDLHVVVRHEGRIYDFDYNGKPEELQVYMIDMFGVVQLADAGLLIRSIPAKDYLRDYQDHRNLLGVLQPEGAEAPRDFYFYAYDVAPYPFLGLLESL